MPSTQSTSGAAITETLVAGLVALDKQPKRSALRSLRGKISFDLDLEKTRR